MNLFNSLAVSYLIEIYLFLSRNDSQLKYYIREKNVGFDFYLFFLNHNLNITSATSIVHNVACVTVNGVLFNSMVHMMARVALSSSASFMSCRSDFAQHHHLCFPYPTEIIIATDSKTFPGIHAQCLL